MRELFPGLKEGEIYLDTAATALKPKEVVDALSRFYLHEYGTVHRAIYARASHATARYEEARQAVADFLHAKDSQEIVFTRGTTESLNLIARGVTLAPGDEIALSVGEHHANLVPWQMAAERTGATLVWLDLDEAGHLRPFQLSSRTKLVAIAHASNVTGAIHPIREIARAAHAVGAWVVVDGAQAAPHLAVDVQDLECDFYAFSGHKCYGPTGIGVLWGRRECLEKLSPLLGGGDMIEKVTLEKTTYQAPPLRFEAGTPHIAGVIGLQRALAFVEEHRSQELPIHVLLTGIQTLSPRIRLIGNGQTRVPLVTFSVEGAHPLDIGTLLDLKGVALRTGHLCAQTCMQHFGHETALRASLGLYNTEQEVEQFLTHLREILRRI